MFCLWQFAATNRKVSGGELPVSFTKKVGLKLSLLLSNLCFKSFLLCFRQSWLNNTPNYFLCNLRCTVSNVGYALIRTSHFGCVPLLFLFYKYRLHRFQVLFRSYNYGIVVDFLPLIWIVLSRV